MDREEKLKALMEKSRQRYIIELKEKIQQVMVDYFLFVIMGYKDAERNNIIRFFHSIKGTSSTLGFPDLSSIGAKYEDYMNEIIKLETLNADSLYKISKGIGLVYIEYEKLKVAYSEGNNTITDGNVIVTSNKSDTNDGALEWKEVKDEREIPQNDFIMSSIKLCNTILAVDDDIVILELIRQRLSEEGYTVITTKDPYKVYEILKKEKIDIVLLDVLMVDKNGYEVYREIREEWPYLAVVFITSMDIAKEALKDQMLDYIKKPFGFEEITNKINFMMEKCSKLKMLRNTNIEKVKGDMLNKKETIINESFHLRDKFKILIIDDEMIIGHLIMNGIANPKYEINYVNNGEDGINEAIRIKPDIVIVDLMLPKVDGFEVCRRIKSDEEISKSKIIVLSSKRREEDIIRCFELGVEDYMMKPFNLAELQMRVKRLIG